MGTYFALMDDAAKRGEDYEVLDRIPEVLRKLQHGQASPDEVLKVLDVLNELERRLTVLVEQAAPTKAVQEKTDQVRVMVKSLETLKRAIQSPAESSWSAVRT